MRDQTTAVDAWVPPLAAWAAAAALLCAAAVAAHHDPLHAATWARWDSFYYEGIARHGYELHHCAAGEGMNDRQQWCGNTAWFPAYPLLMAAAAAVGLPLRASGIAISWLAAAATLVLVWRWFVPRRLAPLACAALAPGVVYLYAVFPLSLLTLAGAVFLRYLDRRPWVAGAAGAVAALAYPLGMALVPLVAVVSAVQRRRVSRAVVLAGPAVAAGLLLVLAQRLQTGSWTAYADVAGSYGGLHDPVTSVTDLLTVLWHASNPLGYALASTWQFLYVTVLVGLAVAAAVRRRRAAAVVAWCLGVWFVPLIQTGQSLWRSEAALVLLAPLLAFLPRRLVWVAAVGLVVVDFAVAHEFFAGNLI
jgi:hypothetical protein